MYQFIQKPSDSAKKNIENCQTEHEIYKLVAEFDKAFNDFAKNGYLTSSTSLEHTIEKMSGCVYINRAEKIEKVYQLYLFRMNSFLKIYDFSNAGHVKRSILRLKEKGFISDRQFLYAERLFLDRAGDFINRNNEANWHEEMSEPSPKLSVEIEKSPKEYKSDVFVYQQPNYIDEPHKSFNYSYLINNSLIALALAKIVFFISKKLNAPKGHDLRPVVPIHAVLEKNEIQSEHPIHEMTQEEEKILMLESPQMVNNRLKIEKYSNQFQSALLKVIENHVSLVNKQKLQAAKQNKSVLAIQKTYLAHIEKAKKEAISAVNSTIDNYMRRSYSPYKHNKKLNIAKLEKIKRFSDLDKITLKDIADFQKTLEKDRGLFFKKSPNTSSALFFTNQKDRLSKGTQSWLSTANKMAIMGR